MDRAALEQMMPGGSPNRTQLSDDRLYDMLVVGGGINGAGIARDAAGRGLSVLLVEKEDLAQHTSSASTKLIHGGLRYLEYYQFRHVREALIERECLMGIAPHIIEPLDFVLPQMNSLRPAWLVRIGLLLYDHLGRRKVLPATRTIGRLDRDPMGAGLKSAGVKAFVYADCRVDDSRLVVLNALDARLRGADIRTRTRFVSAERTLEGWSATVEDREGKYQVRARVLVNAAGPWVADIISRIPDGRSERGVRLVKGSHIVVPRLYEGDHAFALQNPDRRLVFTIPYRDGSTLVGSTDIVWNEAASPVGISPEETQYLLKTIERYFVRRVEQKDIIWSYSGIRPLYDDHARNASAVTREYVLELDVGSGHAPMLNIFGGKLTSYRKLAERVMEKLKPYLHFRAGTWTSEHPLPGGDISDGGLEHFVDALVRAYPKMPEALLRRLARAYGTRIVLILGEARDVEGLGRDFGRGLYQAEVDYLFHHEWARTGQDILYRRSKLGLRFNTAEKAMLDSYLDALGTGAISRNRQAPSSGALSA